ncbi:tRNA (adenosine(37)-N6)-threonylcarbamoyltransferase complex dimerization subunit type 1 TsaB [Crenobacter caeni]|uniref:tRNA (Adenosine(37)-N6)-threonylcarbamoyltransferase complex dimerization subunit type 1 TsaB n=1 Tax=Crenobacter caeni TaxID=2705474 RepID=A0A6B2KPC1_9NEIS|nr:tRNA (adenosine(37)-N6)-threonylcarbamoyltransferase complex dimerization subunit type 1 TsaB [Crenobacter caeni]NDV12082.1 tRNA (adenosine(37)-N6)-threonylcarbamoyltransferase complex dimerization subunit type 1 TsaB [Crenobacter caeni]
MNLLAIDTTTDFLSLALNCGDTVVEHHERVGQKHAELLLPTVAAQLQQAGCGLSAIGGIAFSCGPGSFTGVRIACSAAQGLGYALSVPLYPIPTLDTLAWQCRGSRTLACLDARMNQVYYAYYDEQARPLTAIRVADPQAIERLPGNWLGAGDGFARYPDALHAALGTQLAAIDDTVQPHARALLEMASSGTYPAVDARDAEILYVRNKVALTVSEQQARRA